MRFITRDDTPCWYELSMLHTQPPAILLSIHNRFLEREHFLKNSPLVKHFRQTFEFPDFIFDPESGLGFGGPLKFKESRGDFSEFVLEVPRVEFLTDAVCESCKGSGIDSVLAFEQKCLYCKGRGKAYQMRWDELKAISGSLTVMTFYLDHAVDTKCKRNQLLTFQTRCYNGAHGGSIYANLSASLVQWLESLGSVPEFPEIVQTMKSVWNHIYIPRERGISLDDHQFQADLKDHGRLSIECPGQNSCCLYTESRRLGSGGYDLNCHNVDTCAQQITLLVGLATLHDLARQAGV